MVDELRRQAIDLVRALDWPGVLALEEQLRTDEVQWSIVWAPVCAIAARNVGDERARSFLDEAIAGGFFQPGIFEPEMSLAFADDVDWAKLLQAMEANTPPPPLLLTSWPTIQPCAPLELYRLSADREENLRWRLPAPAASAWETAKSLLSWATHAWEHTSNDHVSSEDALDVLDRVAAGQRFACVEYSIVLTQALNAVGIPARRAILLIANSHAGFGTGHMVSEAWISDLNKWVVLDGQNGFYWVASDGTPLGILELQAFYRVGPRANVECLRRPFTDDELELWWKHFHLVSVTGASWAHGPMSPIFEGRAVNRPALVASPEHAYPDLSELAISFVDVDGRQAIQPHPAHPFATGYRVSNETSEVDCPLGQPWIFPELRRGAYEIQLATLTAYGPLKPAALTWQKE